MGRTAVTRGTDFCCNGLRYQIKACRPSGKPGSFITWVPKATNYEWDRLVWLLYAAIFNFLKLGSGMSQIINLRSILLNVSVLRICVRVVGFMRESKHAFNETLIHAFDLLGERSLRRAD